LGEGKKKERKREKKRMYLQDPIWKKFSVICINPNQSFAME
jgi:hypothetical protein